MRYTINTLACKQDVKVYLGEDWKKKESSPRCLAEKGAIINFLLGFRCLLTIPKHYSVLS